MVSSSNLFTFNFPKPCKLALLNDKGNCQYMINLDDD